MNHLLKNALATVAAAIALAGMPSQATVISAPANDASASTWLIANPSGGMWVEMDLRMLTERTGSSPTAFGMGMDLHADWLSDEAIVQDAIDTFSRMPPGAGGRPPNTDSNVIVHHRGVQASAVPGNREPVPEPVSLALVAVGLLGISAGIRKYFSAPARGRM